MSEEKWLSGTTPYEMFELLSEQASDRKLRLFACACCRLDPEFMASDPDRTGMELTETDVDTPLDPDAFNEIDDVWDIRWYRRAGWDAADRATGSYLEAVDNRDGSDRPDPEGERDRREQDLVVRLRDIFGNPFRPVALDPRWLTADVVGLARGIYEERASDRLPILADALLDAGCDNADLLAHCRSDEPHVRGCWVVDLVLGKS